MVSGAARPLRVLGWPAFKTRRYNPHQHLLYTHMRRSGVEVEEFSPWRLVRGADIWHLHWPEQFLNRSGPVGAVLRGVAQLALLRLARWRGVRVVWTVHNLAAHERRHLRIEHWYRRRFLAALDGIISLTEAGHLETLHRFPVLERVPAAVIPRGHYRGAYPDAMSTSEARARLGIAGGARVLVHLGQIRPYKNVDSLIARFRSAAPVDAILLVAGMPMNQDMRRAVEQAAGADPRVRLVLSFIPDAEVQVYLRAADAVVLPYSEILNSGSLILALSFDVPAVAPRQGAIREVLEWVGPDWLFAYDGSLTAETLSEALRWLETRRPTGSPGIDHLDWEVVAHATHAFFRRLSTASPRR